MYISASIVLFNTNKDELKRVVDSYSPSEARHLFLIDNSVVKMELSEIYDSNCKYIEYIKNDRNTGYGSAHNIGIRKAIEGGAKYHIVLNPDLAFEPVIIDALAEYADANDDVVYLLPKVMYPNGRIQYLCKLLPTPFDLLIRRFLPSIGFLKRVNDRYILKSTGYDKIINPPCLSGCFMFMRVKTLEEYNLEFDERFFMYCEDFDLIRRLHRVGKTVFYPKVSIIHDHKKESYKNFRMLLIHINSTCKYFNKYGWFYDKERKEQNEKMLIEVGRL